MLDALWRDASWETLETIADPSMVAYLREQVAGWSTASDPPTTTERIAERSVADGAVLGGYVAGRLLLGSGDRLTSWPADSDVEGLYALLDETENVDLAQLPMPAGEPTFLQDLVADAGSPEDENLLSLGAMAFDSALACALIEHDRVGS